MAQTSWRQCWANVFKRKAVGLGTLVQMSPAPGPESCLEFSRQCLKEVRAMTSRRDPQSSEVLNYRQCAYLIDSLQEAVRKASLFLEHNRYRGGKSVSTDDLMKSTLEPLKILCMLAKKVKCIIEGCCKDRWLHAAVMLPNLSHCTASLGLELKLFTQLPPYSDSRRYSSSPLTIPDISALRHAEGEIVKGMASEDEVSLFRQLMGFLEYGRGSGDDLELARYLLERLDRSKQSSPWRTPGSLQLILPERDLMNLKLLARIGIGSYGSVHKASWFGIDVAVKIIYGTNNPDFQVEVAILAGLSHPNIVSCLGHGKDLGDCLIFMELMDGDLFSLMKERLRNNRTRNFPFLAFEEFDIILQIAEAMDYLHEMRVLHRDLKSANILVRCMKSPNEEGYEYVQVKVSDFALSQTREYSTTHSPMTPNVGTARWRAPELMKYGTLNDICDIEAAEAEELVEHHPFKCDVYSFGMVCFEILTGDVPFPNIFSPLEVKRAVCAGERPQLPDRCHEQLKALIEGCWNAEASSRPSFGDICTELRFLKSLHLTLCNDFAGSGVSSPRHGSQSGLGLSTSLISGP